MNIIKKISDEAKKNISEKNKGKKHIETSKTLFEQHYEQNNEFVVVVGARKIRPCCKYPDCNFYAMKLIGQCNSCDNFYCRIHRLPETHKCLFMLELKNKERMKLANKLMSEKTIEKRVFI